MNYWSTIQRGDSLRIDTRTNPGLGIEDVADYFELIVDDDGKRRLDVGIIVDLSDIGPDDVFRNDHSTDIEDFITTVYGRPDDDHDVTLDDSTGDWASQDVVFSFREGLGDDLTDLAAKIATDPKIVELHNDLNGGFRPGKFYGFHDTLMKHLDHIDGADDN